MDKWVVYVEVDGKEVYSQTYGDISAAQMAEESMKLQAAHFDPRAVVGMEQTFIPSGEDGPADDFWYPYDNEEDFLSNVSPTL